jgi:hypothetical protein
VLEVAMVRRGSTVRVRQRALQKGRKSALYFSDRLAGRRTWARYGALYGAFRSKTLLLVCLGWVLGECKREASALVELVERQDLRVS